MALIDATIIGVSIVWAGFIVGVIVGGLWNSNWLNFRKRKLSCNTTSKTKTLDYSLPPTSPSKSVDSPLKAFGSAPCLNSFQVLSNRTEPWILDKAYDTKPPFIVPTDFDNSSKSHLEKEQSNVVNKEDLKHLVRLIEMKDGGPTWTQMMDRYTSTLSYQAWSRDLKSSPPQYRSRTVFEDAAPELVRDFFWDDSFRSKWDDMLAYFEILEECPNSGTMVVHWIRKFPFFCSDREYIIGRRIWESKRTFYCVTKGVGYSSVPRRNKPRRVDMYYSSWCIRAVESRRGDGRLSACEVLLFHHEDMGIPREIAKLGVRQGMWGAVKKIDPGLRAYQKERASGAAFSRSAYMAHINTKVNLEYPTATGINAKTQELKMTAAQSKIQSGGKATKLLIFGGLVLIALTLDNGILTKIFALGFGKKLADKKRKT